MPRTFNPLPRVVSHRTPASILKENFGRVPLDCTDGPVRNKLGESADIRAIECEAIRKTIRPAIPPALENFLTIMRRGMPRIMDMPIEGGVFNADP